jgi:hypothetical protein
MELVRKILLTIEEKSQDPGGWVNLEIPGQTPETVSYHVMLLNEARLIEASNLSSTAGFDYRAKRLTWSGHEFLDAARNENVWNQVKQVVKEKGGSIPFEVLKGLVMKAACALFGIGG